MRRWAVAELQEEEESRGMGSSGRSGEDGPRNGVIEWGMPKSPEENVMGGFGQDWWSMGEGC